MQRGAAQRRSTQEKEVTASQAAPAGTSAAEQQLEKFARALRQQKSAAAYERLRAWSATAASAGRGSLGLRAALALGYFDYENRRYDRALTWFQKAERDTVLREYAVYWAAQTERAQGRNLDALAHLEQFRKEFPESVMTEQVLALLAEAAVASNQPQRGLAALDAYPDTHSKPRLLFLQAEAQEQSGQCAAAAANYLTVHYRFPLSDQATEAGLKAQALRSSLGSEFPETPLVDQLARAEVLYLAHRWREARSAYQDLLPRLTTAQRDKAQLRIAQCGVKLGMGPDVLARLNLPEPELDSERHYALADLYRSEKREGAMLAAIEQAVQRDPAGTWAEQALFSAGNYFWVSLQRQRAAEFYGRISDKFPAGLTAATAHWRVAWTAYLDGRLEASSLLEEQIRRFPDSPFTLSAVYWLGRATERSGNVAQARGFYGKAAERFPQTYFGRMATDRLHKIGASPAVSAEVLAYIPAAAPLRPVGNDLPPAASVRRERAHALRTVGFDASAELELRAAYTATGAPQLLIESAQEASEAGQYMTGAALVRQVFPELESRRFDEVPPQVWRLAYPLPFLKEIQDAAKKSGVDPMLLAGLIRQESGFQVEAVSNKQAIGLMQLLPQTARTLARRQRLGYSRKRLFDASYNARLGAAYLADLVRLMGGLEPALAAYNAGEDRVVVWRASRDFAEPAEFVESIPFRETREYVEVVSRNAEIYRHLYARTQ